MRVAVDARSFRAAGGGRGIAVYLDQLLAALRALGGDDRYETVEDTRAKRALAAAAGRPRLDRMVGGCDVLWAPAPAPLALSRGVPLVLTVHDLSFEHRPADYGAYERLWHRAARPRRLARRAERVIAVSEAVRGEAIAEWGLEPDRVVTVLSGPGRPPGEPGSLPDGLDPGFVLAVGALEPRKRPDLLIEAHARARADGLRAELVFAGPGRQPRSARPEAAGAAAQPGGAAAEPGGAAAEPGRATAGARPRFLGRVDDATLDALYARALVLACPSREEGFGFTPLEAAARGTPAVVADLAPFRETLGDSVLAVPPGDPDALAAALLRLEREPQLRDRLARSAHEAAGRLSWERAARETRAVLEAAAA